MSEKCPIIAIDPGNRQSAYCLSLIHISEPTRH